MEKVILNVSGMSCGHCVSSIESAVGKLDGINSVTVQLSEGKVEVSFDSSITSLESIINEIEEQGYDVSNK